MVAMMESLTITARSPSCVLCDATACSENDGPIMVTVPSASRCVTISSIDGSPCVHWHVERTEGLLQHISVNGLRRARITYFMTPVVDAGHLFLIVPSIDKNRITAKVAFCGEEFRVAAIDGSLVKLSPVKTQLSPSVVVVAVFAGVVILTIALAVWL
jgi:hypothetical protein